MTNDVTPCTGALTAISTMVDANNFVGFGPNGSFVIDLDNGEIDWLERVEDCFEMLLEVMPYNEAKALLESSGFQGQGIGP